MKNPPNSRIALAWLLMVQLFVTGCAGTSAPSRFYSLHALADEEATGGSLASEHALSIALGPVEIPDYLERPQIVVRNSPTEMTIAQFDRWAGSLKDNVKSVIAENIVLLLSGINVSVASWHWRASSDYRIAVYITKFDIVSDGHVLMSAQWDIIGKDGSTVHLTGKSSANEPITAETYSARVASMSRALEKLSRDIAEGVKSVSNNDK